MKIIIIEPGSSALAISDAVKLLGYEPIILCSLREYSGELRSALLKNKYHELNCSVADNIVHYVKNYIPGPILAMLSTADRFIQPALDAALQLGIPSMDPALRKLNSKAEVVRLIPHNSPPSIIFNSNTIATEKIDKLFELSDRVVIKPALSAGGKGLFEITRDSKLQPLTQFHITAQWLAQPVISGTLYSVEGFVIAGQAHYIGLSRRARVGYTESRNFFPVETEQTLYGKCQKIIENLITRSNFKDGYFHSEFLANDANIYLIDANFGRIGGGSIALQIARSFNKSIESIYAHVISVTFNLHKNNALFYSRRKMPTLSILYGVDQTCRLLKNPIHNIQQCQHIQFVDAGARLDPAGANNCSWIGCLIGTPEIVMQEVNSIQLETDAGILTPVF